MVTTKLYVGNSFFFLTCFKRFLRGYYTQKLGLFPCYKSQMILLLFFKFFFFFFSEYLSDSATSPINVDCKTREEVELNLKNPGRYMFDAAQVSFKTKQDLSNVANWLLTGNRILARKDGN